MIAFIFMGICALVLVSGAHVTFGFFGDVIVGLFATILIGAWLDHRKHRWTGKRHD